MTVKSNSIARPELSTVTSSRVGFYTSIFTAIITLVTFGFAIIAVPISGPGCVEGCIEYPYLDSIAQYPKDYRWMPLAILLVLSYHVLIVSIHANAPQHRKIFGQIGLTFATMASLTLLSDYFIQFSIVPISLMSGETEGIALLTQYNPHGLFIALEELGYLLMSLSFLFVAPVFINRNRVESAVRWIFILGFVLAAISLALVSINYGLDRQYRFEIIVISIDWLVLLINGILLSILFRRQLNEMSSERAVPSG